MLQTSGRRGHGDHARGRPTRRWPSGPVASQVAIKQLGTNGGGFFNVNSSMPFENPTQLSNFVEMLSIILIPAALTYTYGRMVGRQRAGLGDLRLDADRLGRVHRGHLPGRAARHARPSTQAGTPTAAIDGSTGGNMEGKEQRNGIAQSVALGDHAPP